MKIMRSKKKKKGHLFYFTVNSYYPLLIFLSEASVETFTLWEEFTTASECSFSCCGCNVEISFTFKSYFIINKESWYVKIDTFVMKKIGCLLSNLQEQKTSLKKTPINLIFPKVLLTYEYKWNTIKSTTLHIVPICILWVPKQIQKVY